MASQYEKFDKIVGWLFDKLEVPHDALELISRRFSRNLRLAPQRADGATSRSPMLQFLNRFSQTAQLLHACAVKGAQAPEREYMSPARAEVSSDAEGLESMLYHVLAQLEYSLRFLEQDVRHLYQFTGELVEEAEPSVAAPTQASKKVFYIVDLARSVSSNLNRIQEFFLIKHNAPDPDLVEDLVVLHALLDNGFVSRAEYQHRRGEVLENMVRAYVTAGRFLQQQKAQPAAAAAADQPAKVTSRSRPSSPSRNVPIEVPPDLPEADKKAVESLRSLHEEGFIELEEFNTRAKQIIGRWRATARGNRKEQVVQLPPSRRETPANDASPLLPTRNTHTVIAVQPKPREQQTPEAAQAKLEAALREQAERKAARQAASSPTQDLKETKLKRDSGRKGSVGSPASLMQKIRKTRKSSAPSPSVPDADAPDLFPDPESRAVAKRRQDPEACKEHSAEKTFGRSVIRLRAGVDKTIVSGDHFVTLSLQVLNQTKKAINCVKLVLTDAQGDIKNTVEDATRDVDEMAFPLMKGSWLGTLEYQVPDRLQPGTYGLNVQIVYSNRYTVELCIDLRYLSQREMWRHNPMQVFSTPLADVCKRDDASVPRVVTDTLAFLQDKCNIEGIFRKSGDNTQINRLRDRIDSGLPVDYAQVFESSTQGVHLVAGVLKLFVRVIPYPLLGSDLYPRWIKLADELKGVTDVQTRVTAYKPLIQELPEHDAKCFFTLARFFNTYVLPHVEINKMTHANMAIVFGPVTCWRDDLSPMEELTNAGKVNAVVKDLFELESHLYGSKPVQSIIAEEPTPTPKPASTPAKPVAQKKTIVVVKRKGKGRGKGKAPRKHGPTKRKGPAKRLPVAKAPARPKKPLPVVPPAEDSDEEDVSDSEGGYVV